MLDELFSYICHQAPEHSFAVAGRLLPFCQRCAGVYTGAFLAALFYAAFGRRQRRPPPAGLLVLNVLFILAMGFFGFPIIEQGPPLRYITGSLFGSAVVILSWPLILSRFAARPLAAWSGRDQVRYSVFLVVLLNAPLVALRWGGPALWWAWAFIGLAGLVVAVAVPNLLLAQLVVRSSPERPRALPAAVLAVALVAAEAALVILL